ncbi:MAG: hypothetical protein HY900_05685 [Deltaproteobacteria bacterium]|nr:hypothetical protein [Deltaproteobacteria bacterium]
MPTMRRGCTLSAAVLLLATAAVLRMDRPLFYQGAENPPPWVLQLRVLGGGPFEPSRIATLFKLRDSAPHPWGARRLLFQQPADRNELFDSWSDGEVRCAAASGEEFDRSALPRDEEPDVREPVDAPCFPEELKPWN